MFRLLLAVLSLVALAWPGPAAARTLVVGPEGIASLAEAVASAAPGDTVRLPAGEFYECGVLSQPGLVLEGEGEATVITDRTCEGKAILVIRGDGATIRNLVLARARVPDGNGAGIRLEGQGLTLDRVGFRNDEVGLLAGQGGPGEIEIRDCTFTGGGVPAPRATAAVMVGQVAALRIERTVFTEVKGTQISTRAALTEVTGSTVATGAEAGAGPAILAEGGALRVTDTTLAIGPASPPRGAAILMLAGDAALRGNRLHNASGTPATLLLDWSGGTPVLAENHLGAGDYELSDAGLWRHRASSAAHGAYDAARHAAGAARRAVLHIFR